jgi:osmotically-inducible protein OsmY
MVKQRRLFITNALSIAITLSVSILGVRAELGPDSWVTIRAQSVLNSDEGVRAAAIRVKTVNGHVTLSGNVRSQREKVRAADDVRLVPGVTHVRNLLQVVRAAEKKQPRPVIAAVPADVRPTPDRARSLDNGGMALTPVANRVDVPVEVVPTAPRTPDYTADDAIRLAVEHAIYNLDDPANLNVHVRVRDGVVVLVGSVPTARGDSERLDAARSVPGVRSVVNAVRLVPLGFDVR